MPIRERVEALIRTVEAGRFVEALESFYAADACTQENLGPPTCGLERLIARERAVLQAHVSVCTRPGSSYLVEGDRAVIRWVFDFVDHDGNGSSMDELAHQTWRGDRIVEERFYYDPAQRIAAARD
jgi:ketosteroid isomerase-like protein